MNKAIRRGKTLLDCRRAMKSLAFLVVAIGLTYQAHGQTTLTKEQALTDFNALRSALEYVHPRLYKYDDKATVDRRFDSLRNLIKSDISELDFLALVSVTNASVRCGHLYTIPQGELANLISKKKTLPFNVKVIGNKLYNLNDGSEILAINDRSANMILNKVLTGIAADGYIQTRKARLIERTFYNTFHGFNLYYYLHVDRSESFKVKYIDYKTKKVKTATYNGVTSNKSDPDVWFKMPSPQFELDKTNNFALLNLVKSSRFQTS